MPRPKSETTKSGVMVYLDEDLIEKIQAEAARESRTKSAMAGIIIKKYYAEQEHFADMCEGRGGK